MQRNIIVCCLLFYSHVRKVNDNDNDIYVIIFVVALRQNVFTNGIRSFGFSYDNTREPNICQRPMQTHLQIILYSFLT